MTKLVYTSSKFSFYLLFLLSLPIILEAPYILDLWLDVVPEYSVPFFRVIIIISLIETLANPLIISAQATGNIKKYQQIVGSVLLSIVPISYLCLRLGMPPITVFVVHLLCTIVAHIARLILLREMIGFEPWTYIKMVIFPIGVVSFVSLSLGYGIEVLISETRNIVSLIAIVSLSVAECSMIIWFLGVSVNEKRLVVSKVRTLIQKIYDKDRR